MAEIIWTEPALQDLTAIADYIALDNVVAAKQLVQKIFTKVEQLASFPQSGRVPPELDDLAYRELVISPCRVFYKQRADQVIILFVMRQERDLRNYLISKQ